MEKDTDAFSTGQLAKASGVHLQTIRYYERRGLLPRAVRSPAGYRKYSYEVVSRIRFIKQAQLLGFSLREIKELLALRVDRKRSCEDIRKQVEAKLETIAENIRALNKIEKALKRLAASCSGTGPTSGCPILEALEREGF